MPFWNTCERSHSDVISACTCSNSRCWSVNCASLRYTICLCQALHKLIWNVSRKCPNGGINWFPLCMICYNIAIFRDMRNTSNISSAICDVKKVWLCISASCAYTIKFCNNIRKIVGESWSNPCTGLDRPWGIKGVEAPRSQDSWHMKVVRLSALRTGRLNPPGNIPGTHFC